MELLETQDPEKRRLIETSDRHKRELEKEIQAVSEKTQNIITNALVIGGTLAFTYFVITQLSGSKKKKSKKSKASANEEIDQEEPEAPSFLSQLGDKLIAQATVILLDIAKEKLAEYLQSKKTYQPDSDQPDQE